MAQYTGTVDINAPIEKVWNLLVQIDRYPEWMDICDRITKGGGIAETGVEYSDFGGASDKNKREISWTFTNVNEPNRLVRSGSGKMIKEIRVMYSLFESNDVTKVQSTLDVSTNILLAPIVRLLEALFVRENSQKAMDNSLKNLKALAES